MLAEPESSGQQAVLTVRYPQYAGDDIVFQRQVNYFVSLLTLALEKSGRPFELHPVPGGAVSDRRNSRNLDTGFYDVNWMHSNPDREATLQAVYIPLFKGLAGWRLLLISENAEPAFQKGVSLTKLKTLRAGLGQDWPDTSYMKANGFSVVTSINRDSLISMLVSDRVDYVSRSVVEIWDELEAHSDKRVAAACCVALHYPSAFYFFTNRDNHALSQALSTGLNAAIADGSFERVFNEFYGEALSRARLGSRAVYHLDIPWETATMPLHRPELWYQPE